MPNTISFLFYLLPFAAVITSCVDCSKRNGNVKTQLLMKEAESSETVPSLPVGRDEGRSCEVDCSKQLLCTAKEACSSSPISRRRCCPVLAAWLLSGRAHVSLSSHLPSPHMPLLPDDSIICVASFEATLHEHGFHFHSPHAASCDIVTCFCGIKLNQITAANCPLKPNNSSFASLFGALEHSCKDDSYYGCTTCLSTLQQITAQKSRALNKTESLVCDLLGLMWLLEKDKVLYIPTVSTVLRALMYTKRQAEGPPFCSRPHSADLPIAVNSDEQHSLTGPLNRTQRHC